MQHIYSMRPGRPATAASLENPLPQVSIAKSSRFIKKNLGHALRKSTGGVMAPELAKKLAKLVAMEKNTLRSLDTVSRERIEGAEALSNWAEEQEDDVSDVIDKVAVLLNEVGDLEDQYVDRYDVYRGALKQIREIEAQVHQIRGRKEKVQDNIHKLKVKEEKTEKDNQELESLEQELVRVEAESLVAEKQLSTITHEKIKTGLRYQFAAMQELGEKMAIISGYGNHLLDLLQDVPEAPDMTQPKYESYEASAAIVEECDRALSTWAGSQAAIAAQLSQRTQSLVSESAAPAVSHEVVVPAAGTAVAAGTEPAIPEKSKARRRWSSDEEDVPTGLKTVEEESAGVAA